MDINQTRQNLLSPPRQSAAPKFGKVAVALAQSIAITCGGLVIIVMVMMFCGVLWNRWGNLGNLIIFWIAPCTLLLTVGLYRIRTRDPRLPCDLCGKLTSGSPTRNGKPVIFGGKGAADVACCKCLRENQD